MLKLVYTAYDASRIYNAARVRGGLNPDRWNEIQFMIAKAAANGQVGVTIQIDNDEEESVTTALTGDPYCFEVAYCETMGATPFTRYIRVRWPL